MLHIAKNLEYGVTRIRNLSTPEQITLTKIFQQINLQNSRSRINRNHHDQLKYLTII